MTPFKEGFTVIELMITVAIIAILAAIAIPRYQNFMVKSQEATTRGNLGTVRSALSVYYSDMEGTYPMDAANLDSLTAGEKYLQIVPLIYLPATTNSAGHPTGDSVVTGSMGDLGGLYYYNGGLAQPEWGQVVVNCFHQDLSGNPWSTD